MSSNVGICHRCKRATPVDELVSVEYVTVFGVLRGYECPSCAETEERAPNGLDEEEMPQ
jgi:hypothetical protein